MPLRIDKLTLKRLESAVPKLLEWYDENQRDFVWREVGQTPYIVMVSEFMLQQTQAATIQIRLPLFLKQFPSVKALAKASIADVLKAWQGLGYNRRALNLKKAAEAIHNNYKRGFPSTLEELLELPGIGPYTASAILAFAFNADVPVVDVNIERVLSRLWKQMPTYSSTLPIKEVEGLDRKILPQGESSYWHQALMDLGATVCIKREPKCELCPLIKECKSGPFFIKNRTELKKTTSPKRQNEPKYFGHPRRIWRGRILKLVADTSSITALNLVGELQKNYSIQDEGFPAFITQSVEQLHKEGLILYSNKRLQLPKG